MTKSVAESSEYIDKSIIYEYLKEFSDVGLIEEPHTRMFLAQAAGCSPIVSASKSGDKVVNPVVPETLAKSLACLLYTSPSPRDRG